MNQAKMACQGFLATMEKKAKEEKKVNFSILLQLIPNLYPSKFNFNKLREYHKLFIYMRCSKAVLRFYR